jgi:hypothetical protein
MQPYRIPGEKEIDMKLEMDGNTLVARNVRNVCVCIAATIIACYAFTKAVDYHELNLHAEAVRIQTTQLGLEIARNERDRAMFDSMSHPAKP